MICLAHALWYTVQPSWGCLTCPLIEERSVAALWGLITLHLLWDATRLEQTLAPGYLDQASALGSDLTLLQSPGKEETGWSHPQEHSEVRAALSWSKHFCGTPEEQGPGSTGSYQGGLSNPDPPSLAKWLREGS